MVGAHGERRGWITFKGIILREPGGRSPSGRAKKRLGDSVRIGHKQHGNDSRTGNRPW